MKYDNNHRTEETRKRGHGLAVTFLCTDIQDIDYDLAIVIIIIIKNEGVRS